MKEIKNVTLYACDYCGKRFQTKHAHDYHEAHMCRKNPNNQHICFGNGFMSDCKYLEQRDRSEEFAYFHCLKNDIPMFTYKLGNKRRAYKENEELIKSGVMVRMPLECEHYEKRVYYS